MAKMTIRFAVEKDTSLILSFIKELASYERMSSDVVATEETLKHWVFVEKKAEVLIGEVEGKPIGFALFFHNFSTFVGKSGLYLEDLFIKEEFRHYGYGKQFFKELAKIAVERDCGRFEWSCLDWNEPSIVFYKSLGAKPLDEWTIYRLSGYALKMVAGDIMEKKDQKNGKHR
ncbi:MAG: GNAT family N-acetyltransferase [Firmicutes bacterium]|nr:GNAT family N-acetyltransferase [Bacillota bacterium]